MSTMSVTELVCNFTTISSSTDIQHMLYLLSEEGKQKISNILEAKYIDPVDKIESCFDLGELFKKVYWHSLSDSTCPAVIANMNSYKALLGNSLAICHDKLTPLFIRAVQCHQTALHDYSTMEVGHREAAASAMAQTKEIARTINSIYENLKDEFMVFTETAQQVMCAINRNGIPLYREQREEENSAASTERGFFLKKSISSLESALCSLGGIQSALLNIRGFWSCAASHSWFLGDPVLLDDPKMIEFLETQAPNEEVNTWCTLAKQVERHFSVIPNRSTAELGASMKTGRTMLQTNSRDTPFVAQIRSLASEGIKESFEESLLSWLALAQVNQTITSAMQDAIVQLEKSQSDILHTEQDPLTIALHAALD